MESHIFCDIYRSAGIAKRQFACVGNAILQKSLVAAIGHLAFFALAYGIFKFGGKAALPDTFLSRYGPFIAPIIFTMVVWLLISFANGGNFSKGAYGLWIFLPFFVFLFLGVFSQIFLLIPILSVIAYLFFIACFAVGTWRGKHFRTLDNKKAFYSLAVFLVLASMITVQSYVQYQSVLRPDPKYPELRNDFRALDTDSEYLGMQSDSDILKRNYAPFSRGNKLISPKKPPTLRIDRDYPKLDGAVAFVPVYAAAANSIYRERKIQGSEDDEISREDAVGFSETTPAAYKALIDGQADIIFVLAPSEEQIKEAAEKGITYTLTPIAKEAFVFLVNEQNSVTNLSVEQIRDIYRGKINDWQKVGGTPGKILAFQRNEGSGSQTAMLRNVMRGTSMQKPLEAERYRAMAGIIREVANYRNLDHAIGYSFRFYATVMYSIPGIRLIAVDNIEPTVENIRNGSYPFTDTIYMATARPLSENAKKLHDWFLSNEGQQLIADVGYVPVKSGSR